MFKRFDTEDVVLSSELTTFPTWFNATSGDVDLLLTSTVVLPEGQEGKEDFQDFYSGVPEGHQEYVFEETSSKCMFSVAYASASIIPQPGETESLEVPVETPRITYGQYRALVLGDEESAFKFGAFKTGSSNLSPNHKFFALSVDRARFREKLDPKTCKFAFRTVTGSTVSSITSDAANEILNGGSGTYSGVSYIVLAPDTTLDERYFDAGRVYELAKYVVDGSGAESYEYDTSGQSYGYFLPDIGVVLFNADIAPFNGVSAHGTYTNLQCFVQHLMVAARTRSQESVPSNYVFVRVRNGEFNYSMNPTNIDSVGNIKDPVRINQPQSYITSVGLYNDSNDLVAVAKLSKPLVKDFTKEALIRIKVDY